jgi:hypothetical protein
MSRAELEHEIASGVEFWGYEADGDLLGAMEFSGCATPFDPPRVRATRQSRPRCRQPASRASASVDGRYRIAEIETSVVLAKPPFGDASP